MKKLFVFLMAIALAIGTSGVGLFASTQKTNSESVAETQGVNMAYCTLQDLYDSYGEECITGWAKLNPDTVDKAIESASAEIDGYLLSGGYTVPLSGAPSTVKKYCIDIACSNLVLSAGLLESDPGGKAVYEQANIARKFLTKVAEGKFKIPGTPNANGQTSASPPSGSVRVIARPRLDLRGY